jgi:RNA polymerase sigma-32 factor
MAKPAPKARRKTKALPATQPAATPRVQKPRAARAVPVNGADEDRHPPSSTVPAIAPPNKSRALARSEPLQRYMIEVGRHPLLTRKEEHDLTWRYYRDPEGNLDTAYRLVTANLRLVVEIAYQYRRAAFNILDLIQEGNIGLMQAVKKFDPTRGIKLSSYAAYWIRAYILRFIMDNFRLVKLGTTEAQRKLFFNLKKEQQKLARDGIAPEPRLLAERLQVSEKDVVEMQGRMGNEELSLDNPLGDEKRQTQLDRLETHVRDAEEELADAEVKEQFHHKLREFAKDLKDKEKTIFEQRLLAEQPLTLQEIGDKYGLTRERVRQLEAQLTQRLRDYMAKELPDFQELSVAKAPR